MTERNLNGLACEIADVYAALLIGVGSGEVTEFVAGGAVCDYIYAEGFSRIVGILTCVPEGNGAACGECRADEPVVGSQPPNGLFWKEADAMQWVPSYTL